MSPQHRSLNELIKQVRARRTSRIALRGVAITLGILVVSLLGAALLAGSGVRGRGWLLLLRIAPFALTAGSALFFVLRPLRVRVSDLQFARLIEEKSRLADRVVTAVEFSGDTRGASPAIVERLMKDAGDRSTTVELNDVVDSRYAVAYGAAACMALLALIAVIFFGPRRVSQGMAALYSPADSAVSANAMFINVSPGTTRVPRGSDLKIQATLNGFDSEIAQIFVRKVGADNWAASRMEPARNQAEFQHLIFNIQDSVTYYVEAAGNKSPEFALEVADLPFVKQIDLLLNFPSYTRLPNKKVENGGEVAALKGTIVTVTARLSDKAKAARIVLNDGTRLEMSAQGDREFTGQFAVTRQATYKIELTSEEGERYNGSSEYDILLLEDNPPTVVIDKPGRDMKVTSIQEVFAQARAEDDYGVAALELYYSVNGGEEQRVKLQDLKSDGAHTLSGAHTFFLEEFQLKPGDFISYYAKARDNSGSGGAHESTSDIYFLEVRPFDRQFRQAQQQGGGGGGDQESSALTRRQREIIAATFRVQREEQQYSPQEKTENFDAVTLSQEKLKSEAEGLAERIRRRLGEALGSQPDFAKLVEYISQAAKEMDGALTELRARKAKEAMPPEQRALQQLLRAEAIFRDIQIARGQQGGGQGNQSEQELADLFELQLDKMKNQYETVQSQQQQSQSQQQDEIARRLQELARRQQQQVEQQMRSQQQQGGGGGGMSPRQQQQMIDEARRMARELEKLSRDRRDPNLAQTAEQLRQAADEMQRSQTAGSSANRSEANAQALRALERLEQARRMLESNQRAGGQQNVQQLRQRAEEALKRQEEIARNVDELARSSQSGSTGEQKKQQLSDKKDSLAEAVSGLERDIDQTARGLGQDKQDASNKLRDAAGAIRRNRIPERIRQNNELIENGWFDQARERERTIRGNMEQVLKNLQAAEGSANRRNQGESLENALNRARELADNLESLHRRMESSNDRSQQQGQQQAQDSQQGNQQQGNQQQGNQQQGNQQQGNQQQGNQQQAQSGQQRQGGRNQGQQRGQQQARGQQRGQQQSGEQQGGQQQSGQQQGGQQQGGQQQGGQSQSRGQEANNQGGRPTSGLDDASMGGGRPSPGPRQLESELRQRIAEAEDLRRQLGRDAELARELNRAIERLRRINPNAFSDPSQLALLKSEVIDPIRQIEVELARKLQARLGNNGFGSLSDGDAPDRYRKVIEDYYRRLSVRSVQVKP